MDSTLFHWLKFIDIFGAPVKLTINYTPQSKTFLGGVLTVVSLVSILVFTIFSAEDFYKKLNPVVTKTINSSDQPLNLSVTKETFAFGINYEGGDLDELGMEIEGVYHVWNSKLEEDNQNETLSFRFCSKEDFPNINETVFDNSIVNTSLCIEQTNFSIFNNFLSPTNGYIEIKIKDCNATKRNCDKTTKKIQEGNFISFRFVDVGVNPGEIKKPFQYFADSLYILPTQGFKKLINIYLKKETVETDDGWIMKSNKNQDALSLDSYNFDFKPVNKSEAANVLLEIAIYPSNKEVVTKRIFQKIQNAIADVGGILSILLTAMPLVNFIFSTTRLDETILNALYDYDFSEENKTTIELPSIKTKIKTKENTDNTSNLSKPKSKIPQNQINSPSDISAIRDLSDNSISGRESNEIPISKRICDAIDVKNGAGKKKLRFTYFEMIFGICNHSKEYQIKKKLYTKSQKAVRNYLEISYIISKLDELDKLQYAIFSKEQTALFKFVSKNLYSLDVKKMKKNPMNKYRGRLEDEFIMGSTYINYKDSLCSGKKMRSKIDSRLLDLLNEELKGETKEKPEEIDFHLPTMKAN